MTMDGQAENLPIDEGTLEKIEELRKKVEEAGGESLAEAKEIEDEELLYEKRARLAMQPNSGQLVLVSATEDWMHDALGEAILYHGSVYAEDAPFSPEATAIDGYFQDDASGKWIHLSRGLAYDTPEAWRDTLEEFPEVVKQYEDCLEVSEYRHLIEKATMLNMARETLDIED